MDSDDLLYDYGEDTIYCYPGTNVLKNKAGITNTKDLNDFERGITFLMDAKFNGYPFKGKLDFNYVKQLHKFLFEQIYDWAGEIRKVDISKGNTFCLHELIEVNADMLFQELENENYLYDLDADALAERMAYYLGDFNAIHPFREGNGRAQRLFFRELASRNGYVLDFNDITRTEMIKASDAAFHKNYEPLRKIIAKSLSKKI